MEEANLWIEGHELDKGLRIRTSSKERKVLCCRQNFQKHVKGDTSNATNECPAKLYFRESQICTCSNLLRLEDCASNAKRITVRGCLHHSHPIENRNLKLSKMVKKDAASLIQAGIHPRVVLNKYFPADQESAHCKPVTSSDLYRIANNLNLHGFDPKLSEVTNVTTIMASQCFRGFNYGKNFHMNVLPENVQKKVIPTNGAFLICFANEQMLKTFRNHSTTISVDGTHGTCSAKYILLSVLVFDDRGEGTPVYQCLVETENQAVFSSALRILNDIAPEACASVKTLLSDTSHVFVNSWREVVNPHIVWNVCHWHLEKSWTKNIKTPEMLQDIKRLRLLTKEQDFFLELTSIHEK
ncbi:uncharacterized protein LOC131892814 isoform X2 [Tigriopus californicus]|uniref:uncharacterized protein LOC131892814 isoform X2 n=1 Tax=Tigriopus californicus TaxID=6832 RepID=UPI0027D9E9CF|nr:uncharacterized protein LOC131892814 isoform X2 [Tigriopus californicus]